MAFAWSRFSKVGGKSGHKAINKMQEKAAASAKSVSAPASSWDPRSPASLIIPSPFNDGFQVDRFNSHDGVGCNEHETTALMDLLEAQEGYLKDTRTRGTFGAMKRLSKDYCKALNQCLQSWEQSQMVEGSKVDANNIELLKLSYAVVQLSQTFLLRPEGVNFMDYDNMSQAQGAATADAVRYLRLHHLGDALAVGHQDAVQEVLQSLQPEQVGGNGALYWKIIMKLAIRGCLDEVSVLLETHSLCRRAFDDQMEAHDEYHVRTLKSDREGFLALREILMLAPLPGGRDENNDAGLSDGQESEEEEDLFGDHIEGIPSSAYKLWEAEDESDEGDGYPSTFHPEAANQTYKEWQRVVKQHNQIPSLGNLIKRVPQLGALLKILSGDFSGVKFDSWAEALLAELIYQRPTLRPTDIHTRAAKCMQNLGGNPDGIIESLVLSIMKGHANRVIEVLYQAGGGSGAALPASITALSFHLFTDAGVIDAQAPDFVLSTELLADAAFAMVSSFAEEKQHDLGVRLATRLLLPHINPGADVRLSAILGEMLEHHAPSSDTETSALLGLCDSIVKRKNIRVADGCTRIILSRYRHYKDDDRPGGAAYWLMKGIELEFALLPKNEGSWQQAEATRSCFALLTESCLEMCQFLLQGLLGQVGGIAVFYERAQAMMETLGEFELAASIESVELLGHVVDMGKAMAEGNDPGQCASSIAACLVKTARKEDDEVVASLSPPIVHWDLLKLAQKIIDQDASLTDLSTERMTVSSFDVRGVQSLLERFTSLVAQTEVLGASSITDEELRGMRLSFGTALMRAFIAENSKKQTKVQDYTKRGSIRGIISADLHKHSRATQEGVVSGMLDF